jgi:MYXO-CTERM domain-containing protein
MIAAAPFALAAAVALGTCSLPSGDLKDPYVWGDYFLDKYEAERRAAMEHIEPGPGALAKPRPVLLITGVTIPAVWFDPIEARLRRDGFLPFVYEPPDLLSGDLFENSAALEDVIQRIRTETGHNRVDILAECTGGLIARHYIQALGGDKYVSRLVTFISPQHGLPKAKDAAAIAGWPALFDLTPGSEFLDTVNSGTLPANIPVTSIYTETDEYIQPFETSIIPGATNIAVGRDEFVGHFQFFYDTKLYLLMHGALTAPAPSDNEPTMPTEPTDPTDPTEPGDDEGGGCSATGSSRNFAAVLLLGALFVTRRRRR